MSAPTSLDALPDEICAWCGKGYEAKQVWQKYCCYECRRQSSAAFDKEWRKRKRDTLKCQRCGKPIVGAKKTSTKYCCIPCRTAAGRDRRNGRIVDLRCVDCGGPIEGVKRRDAKLCFGCARERHRKANRERAREQRASGRGATR